MAMGMVTELTDSDFEAEVLKSTKPVFVDFWAPTCAPCRMIAPVIDELAQENAENVKFVKVDVSANPQYASQYGIMTIPALLIFKDGEMVERLGPQPKAKLQEAIDQAAG